MTSWHTKYRPRKLKQLHLKSVRELLQSLLVSKKLPQVFLFAGPKGTGKTSASRILGALVNDPANEALVDLMFFGKSKDAVKDFKEPNSSLPLLSSIFSGNSFLVQEMDAASNRGIDDVRALKDRISLPPQQGKVAVYILDEAHMLTTEAFNALLKMLEEPPSHALFILATTELHKIPETVISRCQVVHFDKANKEEITKALTQILKIEKIEYEKQTLELIADFADGSFRDAVKMLEQLARGKKKVTLAGAEQVLSASIKDVENLVESVVAKNEQQVSDLFKSIRASGTNSAFFQKSLLSFLHDDLLKALGVISGKNKYDKRVSHFLLAQLIGLERSETIIPLLPLELKLLEIVFKAKQKNSNSQPEAKPSESSFSAVKKNPKSKSTKLISSSSEEPFSNALKSDNLQQPKPVDATALLKAWDSFVSSVAQRNATVAALLRSANPLLEDSNGVAKVEVYYSFHQEQLRQPKFLQILRECAQGLVGQAPNFEFVVSPKPVQEQSLSTTDHHSSVKSKPNLEQMADETLL